MSFLQAAGLPHARSSEGAATEKGKGLNLRLLGRLFTFTRPYAARRNVIFALTLLRAAQKPAMAWCIGAVINGPILSRDFTGVVWGAFGFMVLAAFTELTFHFRQRLALELGESVVHDLRNDVFRHLLRMPMAFFNQVKLGSIFSRVISDIEAVRRGVQNVFFFSLLLFGQMAGAALLMAFYNWRLFLVILFMAPVVYWMSRYYHHRMGDASRAVQESHSRLTGNIAENVNGVRVTQGFVRQERNAERFGALVDEHVGRNMTLARHSARYIPLMEWNGQIFLSLLILLGGWGVLNGGMGMRLGDLISFIFLASLFFTPVQMMANLYTQALVSMTGAERVFRLLDRKPEWEDAADARALPPLAGRVELRDITFGYDPAKPVLHRVNLIAEPGQSIALVGHTGSGKSTIINLIAKFYLADSGAVMVDGYDLRAVRTDSLHHQMGIVLQRNFLFEGTVLANIQLGRPGATEDEVRAAAAALDCLDLLEQLPGGLHARVGEDGGGVSLGQRQLICFTRAFLADPRILILDEATSSVDTITESRLQIALKKLLRGRTTFIVAHRLSTIRHADQVLVLDQGQIVERGTHDSLLREGGKYHALYRQFARADL